MIVDASALLAVIFNETHGAWAKDQLKKNADSLRMSTINLAETLIRVRDRQPNNYEEIRRFIHSLEIRFVPPTVEQAEAAAEARMKFSLNLGDCFAYALAREENDSILTLDPDFAQTDVLTLIPPR